MRCSLFTYVLAVIFLPNKGIRRTIKKKNNKEEQEGIDGYSWEEVA